MQSYKPNSLELLETDVSGCETALEAMQASGLAGWNLRKVPSFGRDTDGTLVAEPGRFSVVGDLPGGRVSLGNVGGKFNVVQNEDSIPLLDSLKEESGAEYVGAAQMGAQTLIDMLLPGVIEVGPDKVHMHLVAVNSHDGSSSFTLLTFPVVARCASLLPPHVLRIRHTSGAQSNLEALTKEALEAAFDYLDRFVNTAQALHGIELSSTRFAAIVQKQFGAGKGASQSALTRGENKVDDLVSMFAETAAKLGETAWAGLTTLVEWNDHFSPTRGDNPEQARAVKALLDTEFKELALKLMLAEI